MLQHFYLVELEELLLRLVSDRVVCKAVVAKGIGPLEHAAAVHHLGPGICHKLQLAGGRRRDFTQILQLLADDFVQRLQCLQHEQYVLAYILVTVQLLKELPLSPTLFDHMTVHYEAWECKKLH